MAVRLLLLWLGLLACGSKETALATLETATGPVERQQAGEPAWAGAELGAKFYLGDAARTGDGSAELLVLGGTQIGMQPHTVLRFGGKAGGNRIAVELGAIEVSGGDLDLDIGAVKVGRNGRVRITARGDGKADIKLTLGDAQVTSLGGVTTTLKLDTDLQLTTEVVPVSPPDAGVADAAVDAPPDAPPPPPVTAGASIEVTGKKGEVLVSGETTWAPLPEGASELPKGAKIRLGAGTTAKAIAGGMTLALGGGSRATLSETSTLELELGAATASGEGSVGLPGGAIALRAGPTPSEVRLDGGGSTTKVTITRGAGRLTGSSDLDMNRGESANLLKNGQIRPLEAIPGYFDFQIVAGEGNFTIHDPRPPVALQFQFAGKCPTGGIIELDKDPRFRTAKVSAGKEAANHLVKPGSWSYRLRCTSGAGEGAAVASGRISVIADGGTRKLPDKPGVSPFSPNGMLWTIGYQSVIPDIAVTFPGAGNSFTLHLARGGKDTTFPSTSTKLKIEGKQLSEGNYTYWFDRDGVRQDKTNQLKIQFDNTAPQVYIELPVNGKPWPAGDLDVRGSVVPGWTAAVAGVAIPLDSARRFIAKVQQPSGKALAIRLAHPQRGVHYYLRRGAN